MAFKKPGIDLSKHKPETQLALITEFSHNLQGVVKKLPIWDSSYFNKFDFWRIPFGLYIEPRLNFY